MIGKTVAHDKISEKIGAGGMLEVLVPEDRHATTASPLAKAQPPAPNHPTNPRPLNI
jgi:hypothetical protein